jgi:hypothetical protein
MNKIAGEQGATVKSKILVPVLIALNTIAAALIVGAWGPSMESRENSDYGQIWIATDCPVESGSSWTRNRPGLRMVSFVGCVDRPR